MDEVITFSTEAQLLSCAVAPAGRTIVAGNARGQVHFLRLEALERGSGSRVATIQPLDGRNLLKRYNRLAAPTGC